MARNEGRDGGKLAKRYCSLAELVYQELRREIFEWSLRPGDKLSYEAIAERFGVSTMPVREGIRRLAAESLAVTHPHRGAWVAPCSVDLIRQTAAVRAWLEAEGIRAALPRLRGEALEELVAIHRRFVAEGDAGVWTQMAQTNLEFHSSIHRRAENAVLMETLEDMYARTARVRGIWAFTRGDALNQVREHEEILDRIRGKDPEGCAQAMRAHVLQRLGSLADYLERTYGPGLDVPDGAIEGRLAG